MAKQTQPGQLDRQVSLYTPSTAQDSLGQPVKSWTLSSTVWAQVDEEHGSESTKGDEQMEDNPIKVIIRGGSSVTTAWKLAYDSEDYRITSVRRIGRDHWHELKAVRMGASESGN